MHYIFTPGSNRKIWRLYAPIFWVMQVENIFTLARFCLNFDDLPELGQQQWELIWVTFFTHVYACWLTTPVDAIHVSDKSGLFFSTWRQSCKHLKACSKSAPKSLKNHADVEAFHLNLHALGLSSILLFLLRMSMAGHYCIT